VQPRFKTKRTHMKVPWKYFTWSSSLPLGRESNYTPSKHADSI